MVQNIRKRVLVWTPEYRCRGEVAGQALVTSKVIDLLNVEPQFVLVTSSNRFGGIFHWLYAVVRLFVMLIGKGPNEIVYVVASRSSLGFLRDLPAYILGLFRSRVVVHIHGSDIINLLDNRFFGKVAGFILSRCELICPSSHLLKPLQDRNISAVNVIENFYNGPVYEPSSTKKKTSIIWSSNITRSKNFLEVAYVIENLLEQDYGIQFIILGKIIDSSIESEVKEVFRRLGSYPESVRNIGVVPHSDALKYLQESDIVILPSDNECQPLTLIEAMCNGKSIIASSIPAIKSTLMDYPSFYVDIPVTMESVAREIENAINHEVGLDLDLLMSIRRRFSLNLFEEKLKEVFGRDKYL